MMIQSVWKNLTGLQKAKFYSQLNTSGVTLNADLEPKTHIMENSVCDLKHCLCECEARMQRNVIFFVDGA